MNDVSRHVEGVPDEDGLLQAIRPAQERFRRGIRGTAPKFRPFERKYRGERRLAPAVFLSYEEGEGGAEEEDGEDGEQGPQVQEGGGEGRKRKHGDVVGHDVIYIDEVYERAHRLVFLYPFFFPCSLLTRVTTEHARESCRATTPLSCKLPLSMASSRNGASLLLSCARLFMRRLWNIVRSSLRLILESLGRGRWSSASSQFHLLFSFFPSLLARKHGRVIAFFSRAELVSSACIEPVPCRELAPLLPETELTTIPTRAIIQKHINDCLQRAEDKVDWLLKVEDKPFSLNNHYLADYKAKFLSYYKGARWRGAE
jgi:hypothetical protein